MLPLSTYWVHNLSPFLIRFTETVGIRYYGLAYLAGFAGAWFLLRSYEKRGLTRLTAEQTGDLMTALVIGVLAGGRVGYFLFYQPAALLASPLSIFSVWDGGMASHGGFLGVALALAWSCAKFRLPWRHLADLIASTASVGILFGRLANFINGELWGKVSMVPWAVIFPASAPTGTPDALIPPRHPSQLYAAVLEGFLLLALAQWLLWRTSWLQRAPGRLTGVYLLGYAVMRAIGEVYREPDAGLILGLSRGTFYSIFMVFAGLALCLIPGRPLPDPTGGPAPKS